MVQMLVEPWWSLCKYSLIISVFLVKLESESSADRGGSSEVEEIQEYQKNSPGEWDSK